MDELFLNIIHVNISINFNSVNDGKIHSSPIMIEIEWEYILMSTGMHSLSLISTTMHGVNGRENLGCCKVTRSGSHWRREVDARKWPETAIMGGVIWNSMRIKRESRWRLEFFEIDLKGEQQGQDNPYSVRMAKMQKILRGNMHAMYMHGRMVTCLDHGCGLHAVERRGCFAN